MRFIVIQAGEPCRCPICGTQLLPGPPTRMEDGGLLEDDSWDSSWLCRHVHLLDFAKAGERLFRTSKLRAWWDAHAGDEWTLPSGAVVPVPEVQGPPIGQLDERFLAMAGCLAVERPEISHFLVAETDAGGGPAPAWIALLAISSRPWRGDGWA